MTIVSSNPALHAPAGADADTAAPVGDNAGRIEPATMPTPATARPNRSPRRARKPLPALEAKKQPAQQRATETYERILEVTAKTLADVGIERLSTNLVCERAGLTPPALYRYFPNKYALLAELGQRLMRKQNDMIPRWLTPAVLLGPQDGLERAVKGLLLDTYHVTRETEAGVWITRALRAVPALERVRLESHNEVAEGQAAFFGLIFPGADTRELQLAGRVAVEMLYAAVELLFDDPRLKPDDVARVAAAMVSSYLGRIRPMAMAVTKKGRAKAATRKKARA
jgi:AcrR family transcriptional regulator